MCKPMVADGTVIKNMYCIHFLCVRNTSQAVGGHGGSYPSDCYLISQEVGDL